MKKTPIGRRAFIKDIAGPAAVASLLPAAARAATPLRQAAPRIRFAVIGINHAHINSQVDAVRRGGGELAAVYAKHVNLGFNQGATLDDPKGVLQGTGKAVRHITIKTASDLEQPELRACLRRARAQARFRGLPGTRKNVTSPYPWLAISSVNSTPRAFSSATVCSMSSQ